MSFGKPRYDAVVVGAGPNGLAAAITLARAGRSVILIEARDTIGGGSRSCELTLPGFIHDPCATIFGMGLVSPFIVSLPLERYGVRWVYSPAALAHPLDDGQTVLLERSVKATAAHLGEDASAYQRIIGPLSQDAGKIFRKILGPYPIPFQNPAAMARFGLRAVFSVEWLAKRAFKTPAARALMAGMGAHSMLPLNFAASSAVGLTMCMVAHRTGWAIPRGGAQTVPDAMGRYFCDLGGEILTGLTVRSMADLPPAKQVLFDVTPRQLLQIAGDRFTPLYRRQLEHYRYGMGVFKMDFALDGPIPWADPSVGRAVVAHLGGTLEEIAASERAAWEGRISDRPFVLLAQTSLFDPSRAPAGKHTAWAYCHVPHGSQVDMSAQIENQIERFAPGFKQLILRKHTHNTQQMEAYNPNYIGGDINGGAQMLSQLFTRPAARPNPYKTSARDIYICSSSTPPGGGVHGMSGYHAAMSALRSS